MIYIIQKLESKELYYVKKLKKFCDTNGLTRRTLALTENERNHHKGFKIIDKGEFVESDDGDKFLFDNQECRGFVIPVVRDVAEVKKEDIKKESKVVVCDDSIDEKEISGDVGYIQELEKKIQKLMDSNRILRKVKRKYNREETIHEDFVEEVMNIVKNKYPVQRIGKYINSETSVKSLVVGLSDLHFGKVIKMKSNKFNFEIAEQRLNKYITNIINCVNDNKIKEIVISMTGDFFHLNNRVDQLLSAEDNRAMTFVKGYDILANFINIILNETNIPIKMIGVIGNESRVKEQEYASNIDVIASDSFDTLLFNMLQRQFKDDIEFLNNGDCLSDIFTTNNKVIGITHGDKIKHSNDEINKFRLRMFEENGSMPDFVIMGHIHEPHIGYHWGRGASLCGGDGYSSNGLNIPFSSVSQNMYIIDDNVRGIIVKLD